MEALLYGNTVIIKKILIYPILLAVLALTGSAGCTPNDADGQSLSGADGVAHVFTLRSAVVEGRMVFTGVGGAIDGLVNPDLVVVAGDTVRITLENGDGMMHDLAIPDLHVQTATALSKESIVEVTFRPSESGSYVYFCTVSGHRQAGMEGTLIVTASES